MQLRNIFILSILTILLITNVNADIISIGASGDDELLIGKGNQVETFFSGQNAITSTQTGTQEPYFQIGEFQINEQNIIICIISFIALILLILIILLVFIFEKRKR